MASRGCHSAWPKLDRLTALTSKISRMHTARWRRATTATVFSTPIATTTTTTTTITTATTTTTAATMHHNTDNHNH